MRTGGYYYGMKQQPYWKQRAKEQLSESFANADEVEKYTKDRYKQCLMDFCNQYNELLKPFVKNGKLDSAKLNHAKTYDMKFMARYKRLEDEIDLIAAQLNAEQQAQILQMLKDNYTTNVIDNFEAFGRDTHGIAILNTKAVETAVKMPYTTDGREFSDRIWNNLDGMSGKLRKTLSESIAKGESIQKTVRKFKDIFGNTTYNTSRIIRTETMAVYAKASADSYKELGVEKLKSLTEANACDVCKDATDKEIDTDKAEVGLNIPPFHPFCKCCVIPIVKWDDEETKAKQALGVADSSDKNDDDLNKEAKLVREINVEDTDTIIDMYSEKIRYEDVENAYIIDSNGKVFYAIGDSENVMFENVNLSGATITHNHPEVDNGICSFGKDDFELLKAYPDIRKLIAVNSKYTYEVKVIKPLNELSYDEYYRDAMINANILDTDIDLQHDVFEILKKEGYIEYERKRNN